MTSKAKVVNKSKVTHEGELLEKLMFSTGMRVQEFATSLDITYQWLNKLIKKTKLPEKIKRKAIFVYGITEEYFFGQIELDKKQFTINEPAVEYVTRIKKMEKALDDCNKLIIQKDAHIIELQNKLIQRLESNKL